MIFDDSTMALADPMQLWLELTPTDLNQAWEQSQTFSTPSNRWNAYLNRLCLAVILPWLQAEYELRVNTWPNEATLPSYWEFVNGTAITMDGVRLAIVPSQTIYLSELRVPQEWLDIPHWAADYYLAVQVNLDDRYLRIWGYTTHEQIKMRGKYEISDRTYSLDADDLIKDIDILWVARQLCPEEPTRANVAPLPALPQQRAENLLQRLGNPAIKTPRLEVDFVLWGALLEHGGWRKHLYELRLGKRQEWSVLQWLSLGISETAQHLGWMRIEPQLSSAHGRNIKNETEPQPTSARLFRQLVIADREYKLRVLPQDVEGRIWGFELCNASLGDLIPVGFTLRLLTEDLQPFEGNEDIATIPSEQLYLEVELAPNEGIVWETEPLPENYDREILRF